MSASADERRERVLEAIAAAGDGGVSGQEIADRLGCSRAAVHRHVEALRRDGLDIMGVHEGYLLGPDADPVVAGLVVPRLRAPLAGPVRWSSSTGSTNDDMAAAARDGAAEGLVIGADLQTAGRGRRGRGWVTEPGDALLFSVLLRPAVAPADAGVLPIVVAVAVAEALGDGVGVVWPNDIVADGRKVCGILCELSADESGVAWVVVGIGVNVRGAPTLAGSRWEPGAVAGKDGRMRRGDVLVAILETLGRRYTEWLSDGGGAALAAFAARDLLRSEGVTVRVGETDVVGTAAGLDESGRLRLITASGETALAAGEVVRVEWAP
jgi:BirA family biotin operon repressor/biotin-[acetyl-CoA-carboxylase] ligase